MKVPFIGGAKFDATPGERPSYSRNKKSRIEHGLSKNLKIVRARIYSY